MFESRSAGIDYLVGRIEQDSHSPYHPHQATAVHDVEQVSKRPPALGVIIWIELLAFVTIAQLLNRLAIRIWLCLPTRQPTRTRLLSLRSVLPLGKLMLRCLLPGPSITELRLQGVRPSERHAQTEPSSPP